MRATWQTVVKIILILFGILLLTVIGSFVLAKHAADDYVKSRGVPVVPSPKGALNVFVGTDFRPEWVFSYEIAVPDKLNGPYTIHVSFLGKIVETPEWRRGVPRDAR